MPKTALIIEDDEAVAKALQALCETLGLEASISKNGKDGCEKARAASPDLVILDLLLPGMDGFAVAEALKADGVRSTLVVTSGVYKDPKLPKDVADKYGAVFFPKPFQVEALVAHIKSQLSLQPPEPKVAAAPAPPPARKLVTDLPPVMPPMEGQLRDKPFPALMVELWRGRASGILELTSGQVKKRIFLYCGQVRFAQSNVKAENVGGMQVAEGTLPEARFQAAVQRAKAERIGIGEALAMSGDLTYDALGKATRRQVEEVVVTAFNWTDGAYKYAPGSTDKIQDARHDPLLLLFNAYKRFVSPDQARARLAPLAKGTVGRHADFDKVLFTLRSVFSGEKVTPTINRRMTVGDVVARARPEDLPLVAAVVQLGLAVVTGADVPVAAAVSATAAPDREYTLEEESAREAILAEHERVLAAKDFFAVLRVPRGASVDEVKAAYLPLAKRFHADVFAGLELGDATEKLADLFARISQAHATLTDARKRADYDVLLERQEAGLPTDMEVIFKAEQVFNRGDALVKQGRFGEAEALFKEALKLDPSVAQYHVALAHALTKARGLSGAAEAKDALDKALALNPEHNAARVLKAQVLMDEGDFKGAMKLLDAVLGSDPMHADAGRAFRTLKERMAGSKSKGLFGKLFGK